MSTSLSDAVLRRAFFILLGSLALAAIAFLIAQNRRQAIGGSISMAKLLWLSSTLLFWFVVPALMLLDARLSPGLRLVYGVFLAAMTLRGLAELWMMYVSHNWHPYYGIGHDLASLVLLQVMVAGAAVTGAVDHAALLNVHVMSLMFCAEIYFAWYFLRHVRDSAVTYFVPNEPRYSAVLIATWAAVIPLLIYLPMFTCDWLYAS